MVRGRSCFSATVSVFSTLSASFVQVLKEPGAEFTSRLPDCVGPGRDRFLFKKKHLGQCEKQESNLRTPARIDLESIPVDHLGILARNNVCFMIVKGFKF